MFFSWLFHGRVHVACTNCSQRGDIPQWLVYCNSACVTFILACSTVLYVQGRSKCDKFINASIFLDCQDIQHKIFNINNFIISCRNLWLIGMKADGGTRKGSCTYMHLGLEIYLFKMSDWYSVFLRGSCTFEGVWELKIYLSSWKKGHEAEAEVARLQSLTSSPGSLFLCSVCTDKQYLWETSRSHIYNSSLWPFPHRYVT